MGDDYKAKLRMAAFKAMLKTKSPKPKCETSLPAWKDLFPLIKIIKMSIINEYINNNEVKRINTEVILKFPIT